MGLEYRIHDIKTTPVPLPNRQLQFMVGHAAGIEGEMAFLASGGGNQSRMKAKKEEAIGTESPALPWRGPPKMKIPVPDHPSLHLVLSTKEKNLYIQVDKQRIASSERRIPRIGEG